MPIDAHRTPPHQDLVKGDIVEDAEGDFHLIRCIEENPPPGVEPGWRIVVTLSGLFKGHGGRLNEACVVKRKLFNIADYLR
jgi:hypothetical protein